MKPYFFLFLILIISACSTKLSPEKVKDELLQYGIKNPENQIVIKTKYGIIKCSLYAKTPLHRANFIRLIKNGYYGNPASNKC